MPVTEKRPFYYIVLLILAGESVFILPFVLARIFRPTFLDLFQINNFELGTCFSVYGIVAIGAYLLGGPIADRFPPGKLMGIALILTAMGGVFLSTFPGLLRLKILYGYWGLTTILLFWAAMIKATRLWGGSSKQGMAFGFLDGGRGLVAAGFGSLGIFVMGLIISGNIETLDFASRKEAFRNLILTFSGVVTMVGIISFFGLSLRSPKIKEDNESHQKLTIIHVKALLKLKVIWLLMIIILTGYCGYKATDIFSLYATEVMLYDEIRAAGIGTILLYIRPLIGIIIGLLADRSKPSIFLSWGFVLMILGSIILASGAIGPSLVTFFMISIIATSLGIYAIRCLYFAIMEEGNIPVAMTGTAVGLASIVGYTPDIFMGPLIGILLDNNPGELGHQYVFGLLAVIGLVGLLASITFHPYLRRE